MNQPNTRKEPLYSYHVWDRSVRIFHWVNVICILGLVVVGTAILYNKSFGVSSDGKILLKTIHAYIGYVFVLNLGYRLIWGFIGNKYSKFAFNIPFRKKQLVSYIRGMKEGKPPPYAGHNPLAKIMVTFLFLLLFTQAVTGLLLAGTDLYLPPFGHEIAEWVTNSGEDHSKLEKLKPGSKEFVDPESYKEMRAFRKPFITTHKYGFYILLVAILLHIFAVVFTELKEKNGLISAMFTGKKVFSEKPVDLNDNEDQ